MICVSPRRFVFFFFNDTATTEIYTLSLHDALPISPGMPSEVHPYPFTGRQLPCLVGGEFVRQGRTFENINPVNGAAVCTVTEDRKSTRLNSSHLVISYAVFCLKKKKKTGI